MKKSFLLGLMAMTLPLTSWAQGDTSPLKVTVTESFVYNGDQTETVKNGVTVTFGTGENPKTLESEDYVVSVSPATVKDVGTYTVTVKGKKGSPYEYYSAATATFKVTKKQLTALSLSTTGGTKVYGTDDKDVDLKTFVPKDGITTLVEGEGEYENALKCLYLDRIDKEKEKEVANKTYKVLVRGYDKDETTGSNYYYEEGQKIDAVDMTVIPRELTVTIKENEKAKSTYNGQVQTVTAQIDEAAIVEGDDVTVAFSTTVTGKNTANKELKNADTYTLTAALDGDDAENYTLANEGKVTYTIERATLTITPATINSLTKPYSGTETDGMALNNDLYSFKMEPETGETAESLKLTMVLGGEATKNLPNVGKYLVNPAVDGTTIWKGTDGKGYSEPELLPNYSIVYDRDTEANKYAIVAKEVKYWFTSEGKTYDGKEVETLTAKEDAEATTGDYLLVIDTENGFIDDDSFAENKTPVAKFAQKDGKNVTVKNADKYTLTVDQAEVEEGNYKYVFDAEKADANVYEVKQAEVALQIQKAAQTVEFGEITDGEIAEAVQNKWKGSYTYILVDISKGIEGYQKDADMMRTMVTFVLSDGAKSGESGTYTDGLTAQIVKTAETEWNDAQNLIWQNYKIAAGTADLTIKGFDEALVLDGDAVETELIDQLNAYNGATVPSVEITNMKNFVTSTGSVSQKIIANRWYTLILPFDIKVRDLSPLFGYAIVNVPDKTKGEKGAAYFKLEMGKVPANTLMAFKVDETIEWGEDVKVTLTLKDGEQIKIVAPTDEWTIDAAGNQFIGVYETQQIAGELDYVLWPLDGKFYNVAETWGELGGLQIHPLNGYIHFNAPEAAAGARIYMEELDGSTTAINAVTGETISNIAAEGWYSIDGMKLNAQPTQKGVYINNGKKVVIK